MNFHPPVVEITSSQNPKVKEVARLRVERQRKKQNRILIDGQREISRAIAAGFEIEEFFFCADRFPGEPSLGMDRWGQGSAAKRYRLSPVAFEKIAYGDRDEGVVAVALPKNRKLSQLELGKTPLLIVLDGIEKPGNIGAVFRTALAAGVDAILVSNEICHPFNANAIRASLGAVFELPFVSASQTDVAEFLGVRQIRIVTTRVDASQPYFNYDFTGPVAVVMGSEAAGVATAWHGHDSMIIPMQGAMDSLNVSATAAIVSFEASRQRNLSGH